MSRITLLGTRRARHARVELAQLTSWITAAALAHGADLAAHLVERLGVSRRRAGQLLAQLVEAQWLVEDGTPRRRRHRPGPMRQVVQRYALAGLAEDTPWRRDFAPCFELPPEVRRMARHAFTELVNNAVDHSGGTGVTVSMRQTPQQLQLLVSDDGCGLFERIGRSFAIDEPALAMLELGKGKLTSAPTHHAGEGLYFTALLADVIDLHANAVSFQCRAWQPQRWQPGRVHPAHAARPGTSVYWAVALDTTRTLDAVRRAASLDGAGCAFERTRVPLHLLGDVDAMLASRADARRVAARLERFRAVELDFAGLEQLGHGFADELFRVWRRERPALDLVPLNMAPRVAAMVQAVNA